MVRDEVYLVPLLGRGSHRHPSKGGCLMEVVSALCGGPWADGSTFVDPVLAALARKVNDLTTDRTRPALAPFIPWLVTPDPSDAGAGARLAGAVASAAVPFAGPQTVDRLLVAMDETAALADVDGEGAAVFARRRCRRHTVKLIRRAAAAVAQAPADRRDEGLRRLLVAAINHRRRSEDLPPLSDSERRAVDCRGSVAVTARVVAPDGGESMHVRCTAVIDQWPRWLQDSWYQRRAELQLPPQPAHLGPVLDSGAGGAPGPVAVA